MSFPRLLRLCVGWLLVIVAVLLVPVCWSEAGILHARGHVAQASSSAKEESFLDGLAHTLLISLSPHFALLLFAVGQLRQAS